MYLTPSVVSLPCNLIVIITHYFLSLSFTSLYKCSFSFTSCKIYSSLRIVRWFAIYESASMSFWFVYWHSPFSACIYRCVHFLPLISLYPVLLFSIFYRLFFFSSTFSSVIHIDFSFSFPGNDHFYRCH